MKLSNHHITLATLALMIVTFMIAIVFNSNNVHPQSQKLVVQDNIEFQSNNQSEFFLKYDCLTPTKTVSTENTIYTVIKIPFAFAYDTGSECNWNGFPSASYRWFKKDTNNGTDWEFIFEDNILGEYTEGYTYDWDIETLQNNDYMYIESQVFASGGIMSKVHRLIPVDITQGDYIQATADGAIYTKNIDSDTILQEFTVSPLHEACTIPFGNTMITAFELTGDDTSKIQIDSPIEALCDGYMYANIPLKDPKVDIPDMNTVIFTYASTSVYIDVVSKRMISQ